MEEKLTSCKVPEKLLEKFQIEAIRSKISIKKLVERSMFLFIFDDAFKDKILNQLDIEIKE